jgi:hypothetical protein
MDCAVEDTSWLCNISDFYKMKMNLLLLTSAVFDCSHVINMTCPKQDTSSIARQWHSKHVITSNKRAVPRQQIYTNSGGTLGEMFSMRSDMRLCNEQEQE